MKKSLSNRVVWILCTLLVLVLVTSLPFDRPSRSLRLQFRSDANGRLGLAERQYPELTRDAVGHDVERRLSQTGKRGGFVLRQDYDPVHRLVAQWAGLGAASPAVTAIAKRQYRYDLNDNPTEIFDRHWGASRYRYDADGRIAGVAYRSGVEDEYRYDRSGNIQMVWSNGVQTGAGRLPALGAIEERVLGPGGRLEQAGNFQKASRSSAPRLMISTK